ncbi:MAG: hypothetical protein ACTHN5_10990 [Phycisphaerae bacterium]
MMYSPSRRNRPLFRHTSRKAPHCALEILECRWLLTTVTLDAATTYQTIQGWGTAPIYPTDKVTIAQAGAIMRDAGMNTVRITAGPNEFTYTTGGNLTTPIPISANLADNVAKFGMNGGNSEADLVKWLETDGLQPDRTKMIGSLWSPPQWLKVTTGSYFTGSGGTQSGYDPILPYGVYGANSAGGTVDPAKWTDWARYVLSDVEWWQQQTGLPMYAFSFQNEPDVQVNYSSMFLNRTAVDPNDPTRGTNTGQWQLYGDALQALSTELAAHPEITTKFFGPELEEIGPAASNPWFLSEYYQIRQNLIDRGLLGDLGGYATHQYQEPKDGDAATWDALLNGSAHAAQILSNDSSSVLGWLWPNSSTVGVGGDNKDIWQTETDGEDQTWTRDGAMAYGLKIYDALVYGHVSGYAAWTFISYNPGDASGMVDLANVNNPTASYKYDTFKQFSRWINPGAKMIKATFDNGNASFGGANSLDTYNGLNVASFIQPQDQRLTTVFVNMQASDQAVTINLPAGINVGSLQVYQTSGTQKYVQLADLVPVNGKVTLTIPASSFVTLTGTYAPATLPSPWASRDIGSPSPAGIGGFNAAANTFTISGGGSDIWNNSDQFQFVSRSLSGNGSIIAQVTGLQNTDPWAKAGIMFRDSTAANAMFADLVVSSSSGISFQWRNSTGGYANASNLNTLVAPDWVKLVRTGNNFSAFYATTSATPSASDWIQIGTPQSIPMSISAQVGLAVTSHNNGTSCVATFAGVQVNQNPTVATASSASPVTNATAGLSILGADDNGEANLTYTWSATGPAPVSYSLNATNAAKATIATFTKAGKYIFTCLITDAGGLSISSNTTVSVLPGDANQDGQIDLSDLSTVLNNIGNNTSNWTNGNFDGAPTVDLTDLSFVLNHFGATLTPPPAAVITATTTQLPIDTPPTASPPAPTTIRPDLTPTPLTTDTLPALAPSPPAVPTSVHPNRHHPTSKPKPVHNSAPRKTHPHPTPIFWNSRYRTR